MADSKFEIPRLAELYDLLEPDRADLDVYIALADELGARSVVDVGCGTGTLACLLAMLGKRVIGVDPAMTSLEVARRKPGADQVRWLRGDPTTLPPLRMDLATMTGNVAQVFLADHEWAATLSALRLALRPGGWLVFESRDPEAEAWTEWTRQASYSRTHVPHIGAVEAWVDVLAVRGDLVSFRSTYAFDADGAVLTSDSTLRFRSQDELADSLGEAHLAVREVRDAPDRPGREFVFLAQRVD
jgi:SAM-dependent methyltransferase